MIIIELIYNLSVLASLSLLSGFIDSSFNRNKQKGKILQGTLFGATAIIGMLYPFVLTLPSKYISDVYETLSLTIIGIYPLVTVLIGKILIDQELKNQFLDTLKESEKRFRLLYEKAPISYQPLIRLKLTLPNQLNRLLLNWQH